jgi:D-tyrosyl-tRNA(Tyr) deacylase
MRLVVQRVERAKVLRRAQDNNSWDKVGEIEKGLFVLVGFKKGDTEKDVEVLAEKLSKLRVMSDPQDKQSLASQSPGKMNLSVKDVDGKILVVSQFTLYAETSGGNRPSFIDAEDPRKAKILYDLFVSRLKEKGVEVETGSFGDYMQIETVLDGPVTILYG